MQGKWGFFLKVGGKWGKERGGREKEDGREMGKGRGNGGKENPAPDFITLLALSNGVH